MREAVLQIICAGIGTMGFALFFHVRPCHLPMATLGGVLSWTCYLAAFTLCGNVFFSTLVAALVICLWSEIMARLRKAPANTFLIPGIVPLLPGGSLYYLMDSVVAGDIERMIQKGSETPFVAVGIAGGILFASEIVRVVLYFQRKRRGRRQNHQG